VVLLLAAAMFINYADRGSLAIAAPLLGIDLKLDPAAKGLLLSSFFWTYALAQPFAGIIAQRWPARVVLACGLGLWSLATMACGLAVGFASLLALRLLIGLGESVIFPVNARLLAEHAPPHQRGQANAAISAGIFLGPMAGTLIGGLILARFGWRPVFWVLGAASLLWLPAWLMTRLPQARVLPVGQAPVRVPGWGEILCQRGLWGVAIGQFCYAYPTYLLLTWLPSYLVQAEHYSLERMAVVGATIPLIQAAGSGISGVWSDRAIGAGHDESRMRKRFLLGGIIVNGVMLTGAWAAPPGWVLPCLALAALAGGVMSPINFTCGQTLAGPAAASRWMGVQSLIGNLSGVTAPLVTGLVVQATGSYRLAFLIPAGLSIVGFIAWGPLMGPVRQVAWREAN
jgi:MFS family permease